MILCEKILGSMADPAFADCQADYVEIEWHEAYKRLHQKTTGSGLEIGIRLDTDILTRGLREGDILWQDDNWVIAVTIPPCEAIVIDVDAAHPDMVAKSWEINMRRCCGERRKCSSSRHIMNRLFSC